MTTGRSAREWWSWERLGAVAGILFVVLLVVNLIIGGSRPDPDDPTDTVRRFFVDHRSRVLASAYVNGLSAVVFLWFAGSLRGILRRAEGEPGTLATLMFGGAVVAVTLVLVGTAARATLAYQTAREGEPGAVRALFDLDTMAFGMDSFAAVVLFAAAAAVMIRTAVIARWLGWAAAVVALLTLIGAGSLGDPTGPLGTIALLAVLLFGLWVLATSILLLIRPSTGQGALPP